MYDLTENTKGLIDRSRFCHTRGVVASMLLFALVVVERAKADTGHLPCCSQSPRDPPNLVYHREYVDVHSIPQERMRCPVCRARGDTECEEGVEGRPCGNVLEDVVRNARRTHCER